MNKSLVKTLLKKIPRTAVLNQIFLKLNQIFLKADSQESKKEQLTKLNPRMIEPFTLDDLKPVPKGWRIGEPDFVGIGSPKAGTSWWYSLLVNHPQIAEHRLFSEKAFLRTKELHYFLHFRHNGINKKQISTYRQAFAAPEGNICGEWSALYLRHPFCLEYLAKTAPKTKILLILRNPLDRMVSHLNYLFLNRTRALKLDAKRRYLFEVYSAYPEAILHSLYAHGLRRLLQHFDPSQILVLQYEKCKENPQQEIARTYRFLEVDYHYKPQGIEQAVNRQKYVIPPLTAEERKRLSAYFVDDVRATVEMFPEIDLSLGACHLCTKRAKGGPNA